MVVLILSRKQDPQNGRHDVLRAMKKDEMWEIVHHASYLFSNLRRVPSGQAPFERTPHVEVRPHVVLKRSVSDRFLIDHFFWNVAMHRIVTGHGSEIAVHHRTAVGTHRVPSGVVYHL
jgi:hypothetical protein